MSTEAAGGLGGSSGNAGGGPGMLGEMMTDVLGRWNGLEARGAETEVMPCNGSRAWARGMVAGRPYASEEALLRVSDEIWMGLTEMDWAEAFATHPRIGERHAAAASAESLAWSGKEQAAANGGEQGEAERLARGNAAYETRFGRTFLICANGLSKAEILRSLDERMERSAEEELKETAEQQRRITRLRLRRWMKGE